MSALRYSGHVRIRVTYFDATSEHRNGHYRCFLRDGTNDMRATIIVLPPHFLTHAVDSPEAFDEAAIAAISLADADREEAIRAGEDRDERWADLAATNPNGHGWHIGRAPSQARPKPPIRFDVNPYTIVWTSHPGACPSHGTSRCSASSAKAARTQFEHDHPSCLVVAVFMGVQVELLSTYSSETRYLGDCKPTNTAKRACKP